MSLEFWLEQDQDQYGDPEPDLVLLDADRVRFTEGGLAESAEIGESAIGGIVLDDPDGDLDVVGWRHFRVYETSAPADNQLIWRGRVMDRTYRRGPRTGERSSIRVGPGRVIDCDLSDQNVNLTRRIFTGNDANRPAETAGERLAWLIAEPRFPGYDFGHVEYPTDQLDANNYRNQTSKDILGDIAIETGSTFWIHYNEVETANELFFMDPNSLDYTSTVQISNDPDDPDGVSVFYPLDDATLRRSPSRIAWGVALPYKGGQVYVNDEDTGLAFARVDRVAPMANVKSTTRATRLANKFLADNDEEDDRINCTIRVPAAHVNDLRVGHRVQVKFVHFPGYETYRWTRVLRRTVQQDEEADAGWFRISLELTPLATGCGVSLIQHGQIVGDIEMASAPTPGDLLVASIIYESDASTFTITGFTKAGDATAPPNPPHNAGGQMCAMFYRIAEVGDTGEFAVNSVGAGCWVAWAEFAFSGTPASTPASVVTMEETTGGATTFAELTVTGATNGVGIAAFYHANTLQMSPDEGTLALEYEAFNVGVIKNRWGMFGYREGSGQLRYSHDTFAGNSTSCGIGIGWTQECG